MQEAPAGVGAAGGHDAPPATARPRSINERFIAGNPLRGLACLAVVSWHVAVASGQIANHGPVSRDFRVELGGFGPPLAHLRVGMLLFFALSGYLIARPFVAAVVRDGARRPRVRTYARNRVLRIVPAYWAILTLTLVVVGSEGDSLRHIGLFYVFGHVYSQGPFTQRMDRAWTLDVEAAFYVVMPLLLVPGARLLRSRGTAGLRAALILVACAVVATASIALGHDNPADHLVVLGNAWAFVPGIALATIEGLARDRLEGATLGRVLAWGLLGMGVASMVGHTYAVQDGRAQNVLAALACAGFLGGPLVWQWTTRGCWRALDHPVLHWVGVRAYGIYLGHGLVIFELSRYTRTFDSMPAGLLATLPLVLPLSIAAGALSYRFIEAPFLERRLPWRTAEPPAPAPAPSPPEPVAAETAAAEATA